ncbi:MAG: cache domain-containing protein [Acetobacteraceae bacterium]
MLVSFQWELRGDREGQARTVALRQAELIDAAMGNIVEGARQLMTVVSHFNRIRNLEPACGGALTPLREDLENYTFLTVTDGAGKSICTSAAEPQPDSNLQPIVRSTIARGRFTIGEYTADPTGLHPYLTFGLPVLDADGKVHALIIAGLSLDWLGQRLAQLKLPANVTIVIGDRNAVILARFPDHARYVGAPFLAETRVFVDQPTSGTALAPTYQGGDARRRLRADHAVAEGPLCERRVQRVGPHDRHR